MYTLRLLLRSAVRGLCYRRIVPLARIARTVLLVLPGPAAAALAQAPAMSSRPFEILDNSFLVEEAFNQDAKV
jgi:hypothetical protein